ncbi:MAG TPA: heme-binding domain-containing protein [Draconibacterium sp.]|nr:heme-binding domain-containing protein [Draconibacterium sp.]
MLNKRIYSIFLAVFMVAALFTTASENPTEAKAVTMPDDVKAVIEKSCFGCHNTDSKNDKAKEKLDLKTLDNLTTPKMIHALKEIGEVVEEDEMPPAKFLEKFPDKKLTDAEKKLLMDWANKEAKALMQ